MIYLKRFKEEDINDLSFIMKEAFNKDSQIHLHRDGGPDGYNNGEFIRKWFMHKNSTPITAYNDDEIIGGINLWIHENNYNVLGCIFISPKYEDKGMGTIVWKKIEELYPNTICWKTETPIFSNRNHNFYINKCGFKCVKIENPKDYFNGQFILEKYCK